MMKNTLFFMFQPASFAGKVPREGTWPSGGRVDDAERLIARGLVQLFRPSRPCGRWGGLRWRGGGSGQGAVYRRVFSLGPVRLSVSSRLAPLWATGLRLDVHDDGGKMCPLIAWYASIFVVVRGGVSNFGTKRFWPHILDSLKCEYLSHFLVYFRQTDLYRWRKCGKFEWNGVDYF